MRPMDVIKSASRVFGLAQKMAPSMLGGWGSRGSGFANLFRRRLRPSDRELLEQYKNTVYSCGTLNAEAIASVPFKVFVRSKPDDKKSWFPTTNVSFHDEAYFRTKSGIAERLHGFSLEELVDHPLLDVLREPNPHMTRYDLWFYTTLCLEIVGNAYWYIEPNGLGRPARIWPLEADRVRIIPSMGAGKPIIDYYEYTSDRGEEKFPFGGLVHFKYTDPRQPYLGGLSPMKAAFEHVTINDSMIAYEDTILTNRARPDMLITPKEPMSQAQAQRLERKFAQKFRKGGSGGILIGESDLDYKPLMFPPSDLAALDIRKMSDEGIAWAYRVPLTLLRSDVTNRAGAESGHYQHRMLAVAPRCIRFDERITTSVCSLYDKRLIAAFKDPVPANEDTLRMDREQNLSTYTTSINEERAKMGLPNVSWGKEPWMNPGLLQPTDLKRQAALAPPASMGSAAGSGPRGSLPKPRPKHPGSPGGAHGALAARKVLEAALKLIELDDEDELALEFVSATEGTDDAGSSHAA